MVAASLGGLSEGVCDYHSTLLNQHNIARYDHKVNIIQGELSSWDSVTGPRSACHSAESLIANVDEHISLGSPGKDSEPGYETYNASYSDIVVIIYSQLQCLLGYSDGLRLGYELYREKYKCSGNCVVVMINQTDDNDHQFNYFDQQVYNC